MIKSDHIVKVARFLEKFRKEIIIMLSIVIISTIIVYFKADNIIAFLAKPLNGLKLHFMTPVEGLMAKMKVAFFGGVMLSSPFIIYRIITLASFKISKKTRLLLYFFIIPLSVGLFVGGIIFGYKLILPSTIKFLLDCGNEFMSATLSGSDYFSFIITLLLTIGFIFEIPVILVALSRIGIVTSKMLKGKRKLAIMISLIAIALVAPALDAFTFILVTLPIIVLYELSIWCIYFLERRSLKKEKAVKQFDDVR